MAQKSAKTAAKLESMIMAELRDSPWRSTVSTLLRVIKTGVGGFSGPACKVTK
jgi:hypothetical protein